MFGNHNRYSAWTWSPQHQRHYRCRYDAVGNVVEFEWSPTMQAPTDPRTVNWQPPSSAAAAQDDAGDDSDEEEDDEEEGDEDEDEREEAQTSGRPAQYRSAYQTSGVTYVAYNQPVAANNTNTYNTNSNYTANYTTSPIQQQHQHQQQADRRHIRAGYDGWDVERLDPRYRRVRSSDQERFFCRGRAFMMLWTEPAGQAAPGRTRGSTHFSVVRFNEEAFSEIRRFVVVRNMGLYSQCVPIQSYSNQGTLKRGVIPEHHAIVYTEEDAPSALPGEELVKQPLRVQPSNGETLSPYSRINFGKTYTVEHNVKVLGIGKVDPAHIVLLDTYWRHTMTGQIGNLTDWT